MTPCLHHTASAFTAQFDSFLDDLDGLFFVIYHKYATAAAAAAAYQLPFRWLLLLYIPYLVFLIKHSTRWRSTVYVDPTTPELLGTKSDSLLKAN